MKKIIIITILLLSPLGVFAKEDWRLKESKNTLSIEGECSVAIKVELYPAKKGEAVYTSSATCNNGKFQFSDNLLQWKNLEDGEYEVVVNGDVSDIKNIKIERPVQESVNQTVTKTNDTAAAKEMPVSPENKFLGAFVTLQQTILDMRTWLAETKYPSFMKTSINFALNGVDLAVGKVSELVLSGESGNIEPISEAKNFEPVAEVVELQKTEESIVTPVQATQGEVNMDDSISAPVTVNVSGKSISEISQ